MYWNYTKNFQTFNRFHVIYKYIKIYSKIVYLEKGDNNYSRESVSELNH